jgi:hypothetical protein
MQTNSAPPGWYPDPDKGPYSRFWNGQSWTDQTNRSYEYFVWTEKDGLFKSSRKLEDTGNEVQRVINENAKKGWELFQAIGAGGSNVGNRDYLMLIFRRQSFI